MITAAQIALVQSSFRHVLPIADAAGMLFYERVFTLAPGTRSLFGDDIAAQAKRTMAAVTTAVDGLDDVDAVAPFLVRLGARHVRYGVRMEHFDVVGAALLWTLEQGLGERFNAERARCMAGGMEGHRRRDGRGHAPSDGRRRTGWGAALSSLGPGVINTRAQALIGCQRNGCGSSSATTVRLVEQTLRGGSDGGVDRARHAPRIRARTVAERGRARRR